MDMESPENQSFQDCQEPRRHFVLLSTARSGSTLMMDLLNNHPMVKCLQEPLNREVLTKKNLIGAAKQDILKHIEENLLETDRPVIGIKLFLEHIRDTGLTLTDILKVMTQPKVILLYRSNILDTFVSLTIAYATNEWYTMAKTKPTQVEINWLEFRDYATTWKRYWSTAVHEMKTCLGADDYVIVTYDELVESKNTVTQNMFSFLCVWEIDYDIRHYSVKQNPPDLKSKISNFETISQLMDKESGLLMLNL